MLDSGLPGTDKSVKSQSSTMAFVLDICVEHVLLDMFPFAFFFLGYFRLKAI